ncbi:hypothetical protein DRJ24_04775 [Candidatus Acetothermia bacterium]|nr:MAG: hypothetical protein DRJ24_04775 [Candidatus Acetothermia bacterium]
MKLLTSLISKGGIAAFFLFSFFVMLLWNSLIAGHLGFGPEIGYLQAAGLWFLITVLSSFVGVGARPLSPPSRRRDWSSIGNRIERKIKEQIARWVEEEEPDEIAERIERKIKSSFARWVGADDDIDWSELGDRIEKRLREKFREWTDTD